MLPCHDAIGLPLKPEIERRALYCTFTALLRNSLIIHGAGEWNRTLMTRVVVLSGEKWPVLLDFFIARLPVDPGGLPPACLSLGHAARAADFAEFRGFSTLRTSTEGTRFTCTPCT